MMPTASVSRSAPPVNNKFIYIKGDLYVLATLNPDADEELLGTIISSREPMASQADSAAGTPVQSAQPRETSELQNTARKFLGPPSFSGNLQGSRDHFSPIPQELRDKIYTFAMEDLPTRLYIHSQISLSLKVIYPEVLPNICFVSKKIWVEATLAYIRRTRFVLLNSRYPYLHQTRFIQWLSQFPDEAGLKAVRMVSYSGDIDSFTMYTKPPYAPLPEEHLIDNPYLLFSCCPGLRSVVLRVPASLVSEPHGIDPQGPLRLCSVEEIEQKTRFDSLFDLGLKTLKFVTILCVDWELRVSRVLPSVQGPEDVFANFHSLFKTGFKNRGSKTEIRLVYE